MRNTSQKDLSVLQDKILYIGTSEQIAKSAPAKGLEPPIFLTDVYPGYFCKQACKNGEKWGIISVSLKELFADMIAPSPTSKSKHQWEKALNNTGVCAYLTRILPKAIEKVMIYSPSGNSTNSAINQLINNLPDPTSLSPSAHKAVYAKNLGISRWLNGDLVNCEEILNGDANGKSVSDLEGLLANRFGLDVYYIKPEEKGKGKKSAAKKST